MGSSLERLRGRTALVTGASGGIGFCFATELARHGARVVMVSNEAERLAECAQRLHDEFGAETYPLYADLTRSEATDTILGYLDAHGLEADILINNAGIFSFAPVTATTRAKTEAFIDLHVRAVTMLSRAFAKRMAARGGGNILNMSSMSCWMPMPGLALYSATKAYIRVFSRALHYEMRDSGVRVTVAAPGGIATSLFGLPAHLSHLAVRIGAIETPDRFVRKALARMLAGKMQYINGLPNRLAILLVGILPTRARMIVKHRMLDRGITR